MSVTDAEGPFYWGQELRCGLSGPARPGYVDRPSNLSRFVPSVCAMA